MTDSTEELTNQTLFSNQEPLLQSGDSLASRVAEEKTPEQVAADKKKKKLAKIVGAVGAILFILTIVLLLLMPKKNIAQLKASPTPSPKSTIARTEFQARLDELSDDLDAADPSKLNLTVPPVDMNLTLDPIPRN
ncbi:hypothetical protein BH10PAT2_BH10PAT2_4290 [soil metagenome]